MCTQVKIYIYKENYFFRLKLINLMVYIKYYKFNNFK